MLLQIENKNGEIIIKTNGGKYEKITLTNGEKVLFNIETSLEFNKKEKKYE